MKFNYINSVTSNDLNTMNRNKKENYKFETILLTNMNKIKRSNQGNSSVDHKTDVFSCN